MDQIGVVSFATTATVPLDQGLSAERSLAKDALSRVEIFPKEERGFTNLGDAIEKATQEFLSVRQNPAAKKIMVILTDGLANAPSLPGGEEYAEEKIKRAKEEEVVTYVIGLGEKVNAEFLGNTVASGKDRYYSAAQSSDLFRVYKEIAQVVCPDRSYPITVQARADIVN